MPYTKRIPVHAGERGTGLYNCLEYVRNGDMTSDEFVDFMDKTMKDGMAGLL